MTSSQLNTTEAQPKRLNWKLIYLCTGIGVAAIVIAFALVMNDEPALPSFWAGVLVNLGTTILLAGVLFWLEQRFVRDTRKVVGEAKQAAGEAKHAVEEIKIQEQSRKQENDRINTRLDGLELRLQTERDRQVEEEKTVLDALSEDASFETISEALNRANRIGAITEQGVTVPAGPDLNSPRVNFAPKEGWSGPPGDDSPDFIEVSYIALGYPGRHAAISWLPDSSPVQMLGDFDEELVGQGLGPEARQVRAADIFGNLSTSLSQAVAARRAQDSAWLSSGASFYELIAQGWAVTSNGIEVQGHGVVTEASHFFRVVTPSGPVYLGAQPSKPEWATQDLWDFAIARADSLLSPHI